MHASPGWPDQVRAGLDRNVPVPLYHQLSMGIERAICDGRLPPGARLENELLLCQLLHLSRPTVRRAIQVLVDKGLLVRRKGIGTLVIQDQVGHSAELTSLYEDLDKSSGDPTTEVLLRRTMPVTRSLAQTLGLSADSEVFHLRRLRRSGGMTVAVLENYLPIRFSDISDAALSAHGLYQLLRSRGATLCLGHQSVRARGARADEGSVFGVPRGTPLLAVERVVFDDRGQFIEYGNHSYHPNFDRLNSTLIAK